MENNETQQKIEDDFNEEDKVESNLNIWKYNENPTIIGVIIKKQPGIYGEQYSIRTNEEEEVILPNLSALNTKLAESEAKVGDKIKAIYEGEKRSQSSGRTYKDFSVYVKPAGQPEGQPSQQPSQ